MIQKFNEQTHVPTYLTPNHLSEDNEIPQPHNVQITSGLKLIEVIHDENTILKNEKKNIEIQLNRLKCLSDSLLSENIQLRNLYQLRTKDIANLIKTITINTNQTISDYQHKSFLFTEVNCKLLKQIKLLIKQKQLLSEDVQQKMREQEYLRQQMICIEQQIVNKLKIKLKFDLNKQKIQEQLENQVEQSLKIHKLQKQINELLAENKQIQIQIKNASIRDSAINNLKQQKEQWNNKLTYIQQEIQLYKDQINQDQTNLEKLNKQNTLKEQKYRQSRISLLQVIHRYESKQAECEQFQSKKGLLMTRINNSKKSVYTCENEVSKVKQIKRKLQQQIDDTKQRIKTINNNKIMKIDQLNSYNKENIINFKNNLAKNQKNCDAEISKLNDELQNVMASIQHQEGQYHSLEEKIQEYKKVIRQLNNPMGEIQKIELMMRLRQNK